ncbi:MAG: efflux RND transporter periplasmic adaptor subunit [Candidatus Omnitrophica bacterium]|nr:efflux RND transporter periplasmic adaptor subunit [Candidatus Omnitrophota bacterium]
MRINKFFLIAIILLLAGLVFWGVRSSGKNRSSKNNVRILHAKKGTIQTIISTTGDVLPKNRLEIKPPVNGRVEQILVQEGDMVETGQIVAWMSSTDRAALLDAARGKSPDSLAYWNDVYKPIALVAPMKGQVIVATMQPGQTVTTSDAVIVLSDQLIFRAQVDETDIGKINIGQEATATLDAYPETKIKSQVDHIYYESKTVNNVTIYEVDLKAQELPAFCRSGMNVSVDFKVAGKDDILTLPIDAVHKDNGISYVLLKSPAGKSPVKREVQVGIADDARVEIVSGVTEEDDVLGNGKKFVLPKSSTGTNPFGPSRPPGASRRN